MDCSEVCWLIKYSYVETIKKKFQYYTFNIEFIKKLLFIYYNKTPLSDVKLQELIEGNRININNEKHGRQDYPLLTAIKIDDIDKVKLLMEYANENNILLRINDKKYKDNFPLLQAIKNGNITIVELLMEYADKNNILLNINDICKSNNSYPLLWAIEKNESEIVKLLIKYAEKNRIILDITSNNNKGYSPIKMAIKKENSIIVQLLLRYAESHFIKISCFENCYFESIFMKLVKHNRVSIVQSILDYAKNSLYSPPSFGISSPLTYYYENTPITYASRHGFSDMENILVKYYYYYFHYNLDRNICVDLDVLCYLYPGC